MNRCVRDAIAADAYLHADARRRPGVDGRRPAHRSLAVERHDDPWSEDNLLAHIDAATLLFEPGQGWSYSNSGYFLVRRLIEHQRFKAAAELLHGKAMSYNNYVDADAARRAAYDFAEPCVAIIKHSNPCGIAVGADLADAHAKANACDPVSAFGGVIAANGPVTAALARQIKDVFTEVVIAPGFEPGTSWMYSNVGYLFVRQLIEHATGHAPSPRPLIEPCLL
jgi:hypothetical protein